MRNVQREVLRFARNERDATSVATCLIPLLPPLRFGSLQRIEQLRVRPASAGESMVGAARRDRRPFPARSVSR